MTPHRKQVIAKKTIQRRRLKSGTTRGFGTGAGKVKGVSKHKVSGRARLLLAQVDQALKQGFPEDEVTRLIAAVRFTEPEVYKEALRLHPRVGRVGVNGTTKTPAKPATLIRPEVFREPTALEIFEFVAEAKGLNPDVPKQFAIDLIRKVKRRNPNQYEMWKTDVIFARLTPGELALLKALQHDVVRQASDQLATRHYAAMVPTANFNTLRKPEPRKPSAKPVDPEYGAQLLAVFGVPTVIQAD